MGKYSNFPSQTPQMRPKSAIYTPKRDDEHPRHFYMESPPPPPGQFGQSGLISIFLVFATPFKVYKEVLLT